MCSCDLGHVFWGDLNDAGYKRDEMRAYMNIYIDTSIIIVNAPKIDSQIRHQYLTIYDQLTINDSLYNDYDEVA
jgi:hypothetical protein